MHRNFKHVRNGTIYYEKYLYLNRYEKLKFPWQRQKPNKWQLFTFFSLGSLLWFSHSVVSDSATPWTAACQTSLSFTISRSVLKLMSIESVMPSNHLILYCSLLLLPWIFLSIRIFSNESALCIRWPKFWSFSITPSNEYSGLISFGIDWFDLFAVQWTPKSLLQHHNSRSILVEWS